MADLAGEAGGCEAQEDVAGEGPQLGEDVEVDEGEVLDLVPETLDDLEPGLCAAVGLRLGKGLGRDLLGEDGGRLRALQDAVLAHGEEGLEDVVADREAHDELLPWEERAVEEPRETLLGGCQLAIALVLNAHFYC